MAQAVEPYGRPYFAPIAVVIIVQPTISDTDAFAACVASGDKGTQLRILSETVCSIDDSLDCVVASLKELTGIEAASWLTFGAVLTINHWILAELGQASRRHANSTRDFAGRNGPTEATVCGPSRVSLLRPPCWATWQTMLERMREVSYRQEGNGPWT